jgi:hypothetical protein
MNEQPPRDSFEERARSLFLGSVDDVDFAMRSRLTQARSAAVEAATAGHRSWFSRMGLIPQAGLTAAAVLGAVLWLGSPLGHHVGTVTDGRSNLEDLEIVAASDEGSGDAMDMLQDDLDFYDWADKSGNQEASAAG